MDSDAPRSGSLSIISIVDLSDISDGSDGLICRCQEGLDGFGPVVDSPPYEPTSPPYEPTSPPYQPTSPPLRVVLALPAIPQAIREREMHRRFLGQTPRQRRVAREKYRIWIRRYI